MRNRFLVFVIILVAGIVLKFPVKNSAVPAPVASVFPTPSAAPKPTATPQPLVGFCVDVPILLYHHIQPQAEAGPKGQKNISTDDGVFENQMAYLKSAGYTTLTADQLAAALINKQKTPAKSIVLTFDDGYDDFYTYAYPITQKYGLIANLMIPTGLIGNGGYMRWNQLKEITGSGLVFAYDHTWSHAALAGKSQEKLTFEVMTAKQQLEEHLGKTVNIFTYPYGSESQTVIDFLRANGFVAAFSTLPGSVQCDSFIMTLHRNRVGNSSLSSYGL